MEPKTGSWSTTWRDHKGPTWKFDSARHSSEREGTPTPEVLTELHDIRLQLFSKPTSTRAGLFVDSFRSHDRQQFLSAVWAHQGTPEALWSAGKEYICRIATGSLAEATPSVAWIANGFPPQQGKATSPVLAPMPLPLPAAKVVGIFFQCGGFEYEAQASRWDRGETLVSAIWPSAATREIIPSLAALVKGTEPRDLSTLSMGELTDLLELTLPKLAIP